MAYVVTEACIGCKYTDCVEVCPVDCFHEGPNFLAIDPQVCIDCTLCVAECPEEAIFEASEVPANQTHFIELNEKFSKVWPIINERREPLPDAAQWSGVAEKLSQLREA
jgi:ferredoxin